MWQGVVMTLGPTDVAKHKIFKYSHFWHFFCGYCGFSTATRLYRAVVNVGEDHCIDYHLDIVRPIGDRRDSSS